MPGGFSLTELEYWHQQEVDANSELQIANLANHYLEVSGSLKFLAKTQPNSLADLDHARLGPPLCELPSVKRLHSPDKLESS